MENKVLGCLYGMAIGDAMGMPSEFWSRRKIKEYFNEGIEEFLDGPSENEIGTYYKKGQITKDTQQAIVIMDSLIEEDFHVNRETIAKNLIKWAQEEDAFNKNILGANFKETLSLIMEGRDHREIIKKSETNEVAMKIAPIGCLFPSKDIRNLCEYVADISKVTHKADVAIGGACMIASAVSSALEDKSWDEIVARSITAYKYGCSLGVETSSPSLEDRVNLGTYYAERYSGNEELFLDKIFNVIGCGIQTSESVPSAIALAFYAKTPERCAVLCANLGGDTNTVGAMATAICGAKHGIEAINKEWINKINSVNNIDFNIYADKLCNFI